MNGAEQVRKVKQPPPPEHETHVDIGAGYGGPGYWFAECRCGWDGPPRFAMEAAQVDAILHTSPQQDTKGEG